MNLRPLSNGSAIGLLTLLTILCGAAQAQTRNRNTTPSSTLVRWAEPIAMLMESMMQG